MMTCVSTRGDVLIDGRKLMRIRDGMFLTQSGFAEKIGVATTWVQGVEAEGVKPVLRSKLRQVAERLGIDPAALVVKNGSDAPSTTDRLYKALLATAEGRMDAVKELMESTLSADQLNELTERSARHGKKAEKAIERRMRKKGSK